MSIFLNWSEGFVPAVQRLTSGATGRRQVSGAVLRDQVIKITRLDDAKRSSVSCDTRQEQLRDLVYLLARLDLVIDTHNSHESVRSRALVAASDDELSHAVLHLRSFSARVRGFFDHAAGWSNLILI